MKKLKLLTCCIMLQILLVHIDSYSQNLGNNTIPKIFAPSPEASALGKYVEVPVSLYTGIPKIQIPIYTFLEGQITVPVFLSYQGGGFKTDEMASRTGL